MLAQLPTTRQSVIHVEAIAPYKLHLQFEDGTNGIVDLTKVLDFRGIFAPLRDELFFAQALVEPRHGSVIWPNKATLSPCILYAQVIRQSLPRVV